MTTREEKLENLVKIFKGRNIALIEENGELRKKLEEQSQKLATYEAGIEGQPQSDIKVEVFDIESGLSSGISQAALDFIRELEGVPVLPGPDQKDKKKRETTTAPEAVQSCVYTQ